MFVNGYCSYAGHLLQHNGDLTEAWEDASGTDHVRCVVRGMAELFHPWLKVVVRGESGQNEFLRGPFALFESSIAVLNSKNPH